MLGALSPVRSHPLPESVPRSASLLLRCLRARVPQVVFHALQTHDINTTFATIVPHMFIKNPDVGRRGVLTDGQVDGRHAPTNDASVMAVRNSSLAPRNDAKRHLGPTAPRELQEKAPGA